MRSEFERALSAVGLAINAKQIWMDYLKFVKSWPEGSIGDRSDKQVIVHVLCFSMITECHFQMKKL